MRGPEGEAGNDNQELDQSLGGGFVDGTEVGLSQAEIDTLEEFFTPEDDSDFLVDTTE